MVRNNQIIKAEISPGVRISFSESEKKLLVELVKNGKFYHDKLNSDEVCVILNLLDKSVIMRKKKGQDVYYKLRAGINFATD